MAACTDLSRKPPKPGGSRSRNRGLSLRTVPTFNTFSLSSVMGNILTPLVRGRIREGRRVTQMTSSPLSIGPGPCKCLMTLITSSLRGIDPLPPLPRAVRLWVWCSMVPLLMLLLSALCLHYPATLRTVVLVVLVMLSLLQERGEGWRERLRDHHRHRRNLIVPERRSLAFHVTLSARQRRRQSAGTCISVRSSLGPVSRA